MWMPCPSDECDCAAAAAPPLGRATSLPSSSSVYLRCQKSSRPSTSGTSAKLYSGGGDEVDHSSVRPSHGSSPATSPCLSTSDLMMLIKRISTENARMNAPTLTSWFMPSHPSPESYRYVRRGMPYRPSRCIGKNVRLKPIRNSQKFSLPRG